MFIFNTIIGIMGIIILLVTFSCGPYRGGLRARSGRRTGSWRPLLLNLKPYTLYAVYENPTFDPRLQLKDILRPSQVITPSYYCSVNTEVNKNPH